MTKRTVSAILITLLILPVVIAAGSVLFAPKSPFDVSDENRENSLYYALGEETPNQKGQEKLPDGERFIVKFKQSASLSEIERALGSTPYRILAESEQRLFAVVPESESFLKTNEEIIDYYEPDLIRGTLATTNDPATVPAYEPLGVYKVWNTVKASSEVIVAVLDTGVDRSHEDLKDAKILAGYDAVLRTAGVKGDEAGHGTGVIGLIAATADNNVGIAGIAHGVTVLPVKVSSSGTTIYSSDLISGIRFAADAGAKIINMSVGGYSSSYAEQDAIDYAISKGCILISAAGNGGNRPYADQKSYPASYEGVISVASCDENGERSAFSQFNDAVDVAAYGENIPMPFVEDGRSVYRYDSGTSYSCAFVSGIAALAASQIDGSARFGNDEFLALIINCLGSKRDDEFGYGIINAEQIVNKSLEPIITGVVNNGRYNNSVRIGFNRGTAILDGEPIEDGETVFSNGTHLLEVTDGDFSRTIVFRLNYDPLDYKFKEFAGFSYFEFSRGTATLDGFPYNSGDRITSSGRHYFTLADGDEALEKEIYLQYTLPTVYGIENGGVYNAPVDIRIVGDGSATLDGKEIYGETAVAKNGKHLLTVRSGNGAKTETYSFEINFPFAEIIGSDLADASAAVDEENGYMCLYGDSLVGARIYDIGSPEKYIHFLPLGRIYSHEFVGENLILVGDAGITVLDRSTVLDGEPAIVSTVSVEGMLYYAFEDGTAYCFGNESIYALDIESGETELLSELGFDCESALYSNGVFCLVSKEDDGVARFYNVNTSDQISLNVSTPLIGMNLYFDDDHFAVGNRLFDLATGEMILEFASNAALMIEDGILFTESGLIDISSGTELGSFPFSVSDMVVGNDAVYLFGFEKTFAIIKNGAEGIAAYGAAERLDRAVSKSETINAYRDHLFYDVYSEPISVAASSETTFLIFGNKNSIYSFNNSSLEENLPVPLKFAPKSISVSEDRVAVAFENSPFVYLAPVDDAENGDYIEFASNCDSAFAFDGRLYAVSNGRLAYCPVGGGAVSATSISADSAAADNEYIYVLDGNALSVYNKSLSRVRRITANGESLYIGNGVAVGKEVFLGDQLSEKITLGTEVLAFRGNTVITKNGVFGLDLNRYIGNVGVFAEIATIAPDNSAITIGNGIISICSYGDGSEITLVPEITGVEDGGVYLGSAPISYSRGIGYLDGKPFDSGSSVTLAGEHIFMISLPCGNSVSLKFKVESKISKIEFLVADRIMSVGETVSLRVRYLPEGASSLPVSFKCDSKGIKINENGEVTALAVGKYTVTATVNTDYGRFTAKAVITVRDDLLTFPDDSGITVDRDRGLALGFAAGTDVSAVEKMFKGGKSVDIVLPNGKNANGFIATGYKIILYKDGLPSDELIAVVTGDTDGDGCISAYDLYVHERILRGYDYPAEFYASADMNKNGVVADNDYRALRNVLLRRDQTPLGTPSKNLFGNTTAQTVSYIERGDTIDVVICLGGCKYALGASGAVRYPKGLEFIEGESTGWEVGFRDNENEICFYAYGENGESCGKAFKTLITLRFRVAENATETLAVSSDGITVSFPDGARVVKFENKKFKVNRQTHGEFGIDILNADSFKFDPEKYEYEVTIPYDSALADVKVSHEENQTVSVSGLVVPDSGASTVIVRRNDEDGSSSFYTIKVSRRKEPVFDTNCRLSSLEIEGFKLNPAFSPDITEYSISVPRRTSKINIFCSAQNPTAEVIIGDTKLYGVPKVIEITVVTPDGETMIYKINVSLIPEYSSPDIKDDRAITAIVAVILSLIAFGSIGLFISTQKGK